MDPRIDQMADVIVNYCVTVKPSQWVMVNTTVLGEPLAAAIQRAVLRAGGFPTVLLGSERLDTDFIRYANDEQLAYISPVTLVASEKVDARIAILAPANTRARAGLDPARLAQRSKAMEPLGEMSMRRTHEGTLRWNISQFPTESAAQDANMSLEEYEDFVYGSCLIGEPDPVEAWRGLVEKQQHLIDWMAGAKEVHIAGPDTDLTVGVEGRTWINDDGKFNFPGGEIFTGPVEDRTEGTITFSFPAYLGGREVSGVRLVFEKGVVTEATATSGEDFLREMLGMDEGARRLGEFAFGTNYGVSRFTKNTLFDEKMGGTLHMALGRSYPDSGGVNASALHWDMVYDLRRGGEVTVDGKPFSSNGEFLV
jgi:aminopeptidase